MVFDGGFAEVSFPGAVMAKVVVVVSVLPSPQKGAAAPVWDAKKSKAESLETSVMLLYQTV